MMRPDRMRALLGKGGVVHDPVSEWAVSLDGRDHRPAHGSENGRVVPGRLGHNVMHRLMPRLHPLRIEPGRHRLHTLALTRQQQTRTVGPRRLIPAGMAQSRYDLIQIRRKPILARAQPSPFTSYHPHYIEMIS